ncbi:phage minor capsid protein [Priestia aryabhattai]|uniref:phage minor capsid protein n=1 Tax=Priestia aryabhattai TaxID=412384 RepID=UPI0028818B05|nr:phage minor capsid protein [Priestia aryabhattai]MDT0149989.1 phage minor capsid protein [Priestia aryabhattai]MDT0155559.1 phage minor capsid protein [Priestia aryabhattai]
MAIRKVPEPSYDKDVKKIAKLYTQARSAIILELLALVESNGETIKINQQASMLRQIDFILSQLNTEVQATIEEGILSSFKEGQAALAYQVGDFKSMEDATKGVAFSQLSRSTIDAILADTMEDLLSATQLTSKRTKQIVRRVVSEKMKMDMAQARGRRTMSKNIIQELTKQGLTKSVKEKGFVGIIDRKGRKWELNRYVDLVVRSKYKQARVEAMRTEAIERDIDLAVISSHGAKDACRNYEGMVISINGTTAGYPTYEELRASNKIFHPNCKHTIYAIRSVDLLSDKEQQINAEKREKYNKN